MCSIRVGISLLIPVIWLTIGFVHDARAFACLGTSVMTCNPWHDSVARDAYFQVAGRVKHKGSSTGVIQVFCPIYNTTGRDVFRSDQEDTWNVFRITYLDPDGSGDKARVTAALRLVNDSGIVRTVVELDSNVDGTASEGETTMEKNIIGHVFNFTEQHFYVQISVTRTDTNVEPSVAAYNICGRD